MCQEAADGRGVVAEALFAPLVLAWHSAATNLGALAVFVAFVLLSTVGEAVYGRFVRGHFLGRPYGSRA